MSRASDVATLYLELLYSHVLIFGGDDPSEKIGVSRKVDMDIVRSFRWLYFPYGPSLQLQDFPIYASRLKIIQMKMSSWRPHSIPQLFTRPYYDPLAYYAFWFAAIIGILSILSLGATLAQSYAAFKALN
jgi:hypothetical protein